jgi:coenzyme PQQ precursor peptide PqqA
MAWSKPKLVEICVGLEINAYYPRNSDRLTLSQEPAARVSLLKEGRARGRCFGVPPP